MRGTARERVAEGSQEGMLRSLSSCTDLQLSPLVQAAPASQKSRYCSCKTKNQTILAQQRVNGGKGWCEEIFEIKRGYSPVGFSHS